MVNVAILEIGADVQPLAGAELGAELRADVVQIVDPTVAVFHVVGCSLDGRGRELRAGQRARQLFVHMCIKVERAQVEGRRKQVAAAEVHPLASLARPVAVPR